MSCTRIMDTRLQEAEGFGEESSGKKKSKFKSIKKFFGKRKRKETLPSSGSGSLKLYQSTSDVTTSDSMHVGYDSEDEPEICNSVMGSRALSHDSIFIAEAAQEPARPVRVFSQENVSGRIRALQLKLQQNWKFGRSSPFGTPSKRMDDAGMSSEDDGLPRSPPEMSLLQEIINSKTAQFSDSHKHLSSLSLAGTGSEEEEQVTSGPWRTCSAESQLFPRKSSVKIIAVPVSDDSLSPPADFDTPPEFTTVLDNSAAKHKLLVKPRNQRSSRMRRPPSKSLSESQNDLSSTPEEDECERKEAPAELTYEGVSSNCQALTESTASSNNAVHSQQLEMSKGLQPSLSHQDEKSSVLHSTSPLDLPPFEKNSEGCQKSELESTGKGLGMMEPEPLPQAINPASVSSHSGSGLPQQSSASQSGWEDKNPFQVKLRSTSLSLRYRVSSSRESKEMKRHSAEFNLEKEGLPSPLLKSEKAEVRKITDVDISDNLNETCKTKTKSPEQSSTKPPLPRKPVLQQVVITGTNTSLEKQEKVIKCPESKNEEEKDLEKKSDPSEVP
ncbi:PREDICTED: uncharacterized protein KIAA1211-like, partial [Gekko japonicus]|uniref:Uncharacterized protein KIAA1211-like n=1 Tax=Gekko japonicus TaxID=146911 RepID=A0ABM1KWD8_GEKJA